MSGVLLVGAGPSAISARLWFHNLERPVTWWTDGRSMGGTLLRVGNPINVYAGVPAEHGRALAGTMTAQLQALGLAPNFGYRVTHVARRENALLVSAEHAGSVVDLPFDHVVLATGTRPRLLGLPGERALLERGVEISVTRRRDAYRGQEVAVVGGGDAALEGALLLAEANCRVHLIHRRTDFRGQQRFTHGVTDNPRITIHRDTEVDALDVEGDTLRAICLSNGLRMQVAAVFVRIGVEPATPSGMPSELLDEHGYIRTTCDGATSIPGLFAVGDVASPYHQSVAWAIGSGARTAWHIATKR